MSQAAILIVDDEELIRETLRLDMLDMGYAVDLAASGEEATALLGKEYDLIITDLIMEGVDGMEVLRLAGLERVFEFVDWQFHERPSVEYSP